MDLPTIKAWPREERGTRACRRLRGRGLTPVVLYGRGEPNVLLSVRGDDLSKLLSEHNLIVQVEWDEHLDPAQIKQLRYDAYGDSVLHADFGRISLTETIRVAVPVRTHGEHAGAKEGGVLDMPLHEIEIECLPGNVPDNITVEVGELKIGDALRIGDIKFPEGVKPVPSPEVVVVTVLQPAEIPEEAVAAEEELVSAEPEVIGKAEEEEEEEAAEGAEAGAEPKAEKPEKQEKQPKQEKQEKQEKQ